MNSCFYFLIFAILLSTINATTIPKVCGRESKFGVKCLGQVNRVILQKYPKSQGLATDDEKNGDCKCEADSPGIKDCPNDKDHKETCNTLCEKLECPKHEIKVEGGKCMCRCQKCPHGHNGE